MRTKKLALIILVLLSAIINSCKKEDSPPPSSNNTPNTTVQSSILGTWTWTEAYTPDNSGQYTVPLDPNGVPSNKQITYSGDGTYTSNWNYAQMGTPPATNSDSGTYIKGDSLIMTSNVTGLKVRAKVIKITSNELWFRYNGNANYELHFVK